jgi:hypothetical protein
MGWTFGFSLRKMGEVECRHKEGLWTSDASRTIEKTKHTNELSFGGYPQL